MKTILGFSIRLGGFFSILQIITGSKFQFPCNIQSKSSSDDSTRSHALNQIYLMIQSVHPSVQSVFCFEKNRQLPIQTKNSQTIYMYV